MRKRLPIVIPVLAAVIAGAWGFWQNQARARYQAALEAGYQRQFYDLIDQVEQLQVVTGKALAAASKEQRVSHLTEVWFRANAAQDALSQLPLRGINTSASRKFLAQLGDYANSIARQEARGKEMDARARSQLERFEGETARLSRQLHGLEQRLSKDGFRWAAVAPPGARGLFRILPARGQKGVTSDLNAFSTMEERMQKLPALIYDGPFSDDREKAKPLGLTGTRIARDRAPEIARRFADLPANPPYQPAARPRPTAGRLPAYSVALQRRDGQAQVYADVSQTGGHVIWYLNSRTVGPERLGPGDALDRARRFLVSRGYRNMVPLQTAREDKALVFSFAAQQDGVILYPDQVKVKVALDDGQVIGFDARSYLMSHRHRDIPQPKLTASEARRRVNHGFAARTARLAVIPTPGGGELLAYEVRATKGGDTYLVFINALTGREEDILKVVDVAGSKLVM